MKMPIPADWDGTSFCRFAVCWPDSPLYRIILRGLLTEACRGYFWDERTGNIKDTLAGIRQTMDYNLELSEVLMACNDNGIAEAIQAVANAVIQSSINISNSANSSAGGCCDDTIININGGVQGVVTQPVGGNSVPIYGSQPPITVPPGELPEGFETQEEWDLSKCQIANGILDGVISALKWFAALNFGQTVGLAALVLAGITGMLVFPPLMIGVLVGALLIMVGLTGTLVQVADYLQDNREEWVCWMVISNSTESIIALIADGIDTIIAFLSVSSVAGAAIKTILLLLFNSNTLNQLMTKTAHSQYPDADCSGCQPIFCEYLFTSGLEGWETLPTYRAISHLSSDGGVMVLDGEGGGGSNWSAAVLSAADLAACLGVETTDLILSRLSWEIEYKIFNTTYNTTIFVQARTPEDEYHSFEDYFNNTDYDVISHDYPEVADLLGEFQIFSGNSGVGSGNEFVTWITRIKIFYTA